MSWTWSWWVMKYLLILWGIQLCYVCLLYRWYYGNINRQKAEKLLLASQNKTGSFLVRISESHSDEYTISGLFPYFRSLSHTHCLDWMPGDLPPVRIPSVFLSYIISVLIFFLFSSPIFCLICMTTASTSSILLYSA